MPALVHKLALDGSDQFRLNGAGWSAVIYSLTIQPCRVQIGVSQ